MDDEHRYRLRGRDVTLLVVAVMAIGSMVLGVVVGVVVTRHADWPHPVAYLIGVVVAVGALAAVGTFLPRAWRD